MICLVVIYHVFHIDYPGPAKGVCLFLQEHILHHFLSKSLLGMLLAWQSWSFLVSEKILRVCSYCCGYHVLNSSFFDVNMSVVVKEFEKNTFSSPFPLVWLGKQMLVSDFSLP